MRPNSSVSRSTEHALILKPNLPVCVNEDQPNGRDFPGPVVKKLPSRTSLVIQGLGPRAPNTRGMGSIPDQGTRSHVLQLRVCMPQLKIPHTKKRGRLSWWLSSKRICLLMQETWVPSLLQEDPTSLQSN